MVWTLLETYPRPQCQYAQSAGSTVSLTLCAKNNIGGKKGGHREDRVRCILGMAITTTTTTTAAAVEDIARGKAENEGKGGSRAGEEDDADYRAAASTHAQGTGGHGQKILMTRRAGKRVRRGGGDPGGRAVVRVERRKKYTRGR